MYYCGNELVRNTFWLEIEEVEMFIRTRSYLQPLRENKF